MNKLAAMLKNVEIEVNSRCNRHCSYCPVSVLPVPPVARLMSDEVFERILGELARVLYRGRISFHFYNEPLLRHDLERLIARCATQLPHAYQVLYTNGDLLTDARYGSLIEAGLAYVVITSHDGSPHPERARQFVQYPTGLELTNRGGIMRDLPPSNDEHRRQPCFAPSEMLVVTVSGDVHLCYEDAQRKHVLGNLTRQTIEEIWWSNELKSLREKLESGRRSDATDICQNCTNMAHAAAGKSAASEPFWNSLDVPWR